MGQITELAKTLVGGNLGVKDAKKLIATAKSEGITEAETAELKSLLTGPELGDKFTAQGRKTLEAFLAGAHPPPPPPPPALPKSVSELLPDLSPVSDPAALPERFKADYATVMADLVGHPGLSEDDKANRTFEFFQRYASKVTSLLGYNAPEEKRTAVAKAFGEVLQGVGFGAMLNADKDNDGVSAAIEILLGDSPDDYTVRANHKPWTTTYWPMAGNMDSPEGSPSSNLWAKGGPLDKFDQFLKARGKKEGALAFEQKPSLNWLLRDSKVMAGKTRYEESGHYIPNSTLSEKDAERTTGVDFNGDKKIEANVQWDFLDGQGHFGSDGKTEGTMSVGWFGSCDKVALAGNLFKQPTKDVTIDGVTFTAQDVKGLLTVIADSQSPGSIRSRHVRG